MSDLSAKLLDVLFFIVGFLLLIAIAGTPLPENLSLEYVPDAVRGLTTLTGVLVALMVFCITYLLGRFEDEEIRRWLRSRVPFAVFLIALTLLFAVSAYTELVYGNLFGSIKMMLVSVVIISMLFIDTVFILAFMEEGFQSVQKERRRENNVTS